MRMQYKHEEWHLPGEFDVDKRVALTRGFLDFEKQIRSKLGNKLNLLDNYLWTFLCTLNVSDAYQSVMRGFDDACILDTLIYSVLDNADKYTDHPFYPPAVDFIQRHPLPEFDRECRGVVYHLAMADAWLEYSLRVEKEEFNYWRTFAGVTEEKERKLRDKLCAALGDSEALDGLLRNFTERHCAVPLLSL